MDYGIKEAVDRLILGRLSTANAIVGEMTSCAGIGAYSKPMSMIMPKKVKGTPDDEEVDEAKIYNDLTQRVVMNVLRDFKFRDLNPSVQPDGSYDYTWSRGIGNKFITVTLPILQKDAPYEWQLREYDIAVKGGAGRERSSREPTKTLEGQDAISLRQVLKFLFHQDEEEQDSRGYSLSSYSGGNSTVGYKEIGHNQPETSANIRSLVAKWQEKAEKKRKIRIHNMKFVGTKPLTFSGTEPDGSQSG